MSHNLRLTTRDGFDVQLLQTPTTVTLEALDETMSASDTSCAYEEYAWDHAPESGGWSATAIVRDHLREVKSAVEQGATWSST